ncbi:MAG: class I SAM-dependent methyltransferase [Methylococcaceae bacterium]
MQRISLVSTAHNLIKEVLHAGAIAIDATVGNGHDTLFLVEQVSPSGKVFGFDIQQAAIESTHQKCLQTHHPECLTLIHASHADMADRIPAHHHGTISVIMFNLGYLPGGDKTIITCTDSTITALQSASQLLSNQGIITVMAYPGHSGGDLETAQVENWCEQLDKNQFCVSFFYSKENNSSAPRLFTVVKKTFPKGRGS